jgi:hypothetical protein
VTPAFLLAYLLGFSAVTLYSILARTISTNDNEPRMHQHSTCLSTALLHEWLSSLTWGGVVLNLVLELVPVPHAVAVADQLPDVLTGTEELNLRSREGNKNGSVTLTH